MPIETDPDQAIKPENTEVHDSKIRLLKFFIQLAQKEKMDYEEVVERIDQVARNNFISQEEAKNLKHELNLALGRSTEQIHDAKLGLIRLFIQLAQKDQMDGDEVLERIQQVTDKGFISAEEQTQLIQELKYALGETPEQIRSDKMKLMELFISLYHKGQMDKDEVEEHIQHVLEKQYILEEDAKSLRLQLEVAEVNQPVE